MLMMVLIMLELGIKMILHCVFLLCFYLWMAFVIMMLVMLNYLMLFDVDGLCVFLPCANMCPS